MTRFISRAICLFLPVTALSLAVSASPALGQVSVEMLIGRITSADSRDPYELSADFQATLVLVAGGSRTTGVAAGSFREFRHPSEPRRWKITVQRLDLPLLLRPFAGAVRRLIEERAESQSESIENFRSHDFFIQEERGGQYVLAGVRRDLVDEAIDRYGQASYKADPETRRRIARWLFTSPSMRGFVVRSGPPYAMRLVVDEQGLVYESGLFYNWGEAVTKITYTTIGGHPAWHDVQSTVASEVAGLGHVDGLLSLSIRNYTIVMPAR